MAKLLLSFKRVNDSEIIIHGFLAPNLKRCEDLMKKHADACPQFGPAVRAEETIEQEIDVDGIPEFDDVAIGEWLDEEFALGDDEEDDDDEAEEEEEEEDDETK